MALAGATVAETRGGSTLDNPASGGFQESLLSSTLSYGEPQDNGVQTDSSVALKQGYQMIGASILPLDFLSIGATYQTLDFKSSNKPDASRTLFYTDNISEIDFTLAYKLGNLAIGASVSNADSKREINLITTNAASYSATTQATGSTTLKAGVQLMATKSLSLGVFFREPSKFTLNSSGENSLAFFNSSYHPQVLQAGFVYRPLIESKKSGPFSLQNIAIAAQIDQYTFPYLPDSNKIYSGPGVVFGSLNAFELNTKESYAPRLGIELPVITTWIFSTYTRTGLYYEPAYLKSGKPRLHTTAGALIRFWYLAFEGAIDVAKDYRNWNYGVGLDFDLR
jgi:hypothetical protein